MATTENMDMVCGAVLKLSKLQISWNSRYMIVNDNCLNLYRSEKAYKCGVEPKYSVSLLDTKIEEITEQNDQIKIQIIAQKQKFKLQVNKSLWNQLQQIYNDINNKESSQSNNDNNNNNNTNAVDTSAHKKEDDDQQENEIAIENQEQKTQDIDTNDNNKQIPTESHEIMKFIDDNDNDISTQKDNIEIVENQNESVDTNVDESVDEAVSKNEFVYKPSINNGIYGSFCWSNNNKTNSSSYKPSLNNGSYGSFCWNNNNQQINTSSYKPSLNNGSYGSYMNAANVILTDNKDDIETNISHKWNHRYQEILDINPIESNESMDKKQQCIELITEFCTVCKTNSIQLIENKIQNKEIQDINGFNQIAANIYLRDEIEFIIIDNDNSSTISFDEASLSILHWRQYAKAFDGIKYRLCTPLVCMVTYLNYNIYCKPVFNKEKELVFGRNDDNTFKYDQEISKLIDEASKKLNLSSHSCKYDENIQISTSSDIQIYKIENSFYIENVATLYPVDIVYCINSETQKSNQNARIHPQLVQLHSKPISSDAFIPPNDDKNDEIASKMLYNLHSKIIPKFAEDINTLKIKILDCHQLTTLMLQKGINMRYIGEIYSSLTIRYAKEIFCVEMIAQVLKAEIVNMPLNSTKELKQNIRYFLNCFKDIPDNSTTITELKSIQLLITDKYGVNISKMFNKLSFPFLQNEFNQIFNFSQNNEYSFHPRLSLSVPNPFILNIPDLNPQNEMSLRNELNILQQNLSNINPEILLKSCDEIQKQNPSLMLSIQNEWIKLQHLKLTVNEDNFETFRLNCLTLISSIEKIFPFHLLRVDIQCFLCQTYSSIANSSNNNNQSQIEYACSLYEDCLNVSTNVLGVKHPRSLLIRVQLCKLLHLNNKYSESVEKLESILQLIRNVFGENSLNVATIARLLCDVYYDIGEYNKVLTNAMLFTKIFEKRKGLTHNDCINGHLYISLIAEKLSKYSLCIRFLKKLYDRLKKDNANFKKPWNNPDIRILCIAISRIKLKIINKNKLNNILKKWKQNYNPKKSNDYIKFEQLIIENLCLNPIQKTNDLLKITTDPMEVICWINIIKKFEKHFLGISQCV